MYLELNDGDRQQQYKALIPRCIDHEFEIAFEFEGDDPDAGAFQGKGKLDKTASTIVGDGQIRWSDGVVIDTTVRGTIEYFNGQVIVEGQWLEESGGDIYDLFIELEEH